MNNIKLKFTKINYKISCSKILNLNVIKIKKLSKNYSLIIYKRKTKEKVMIKII